MSERSPKRPPVVDPLADYQPKTELGRIVMETRRKLAGQGVPFLDWDELEREIARQRFGIGETDDANVGAMKADRRSGGDAPVCCVNTIR